MKTKKLLFTDIGSVEKRHYKPSRDEYLELCKSNGFKSNGYHIEDEAERSDYIKSLDASEKALNENRILKFRGSDETRDRDGDIIRVNGWDLKNFRKNPQFLWMHNRQKGIARVLKVWKETSDTGAPGNKSLMFLVYFPENTSEDTDEVFKKYEEGIYNAVSVGFNPTKINNPRTPEEREKVGLEPFGYGVEIKTAELLELSGVTIPANPNALQSKGLTDIDVEGMYKSLDNDQGKQLAELVERAGEAHEMKKQMSELIGLVRGLTSDVVKMSNFIQTKNLSDLHGKLNKDSQEGQTTESNDLIEKSSNEAIEKALEVFNSIGGRNV